jgi:hypothetical protein
VTNIDGVPTFLCGTSPRKESRTYDSSYINFIFMHLMNEKLLNLHLINYMHCVLQLRKVENYSRTAQALASTMTCMSYQEKQNVRGTRLVIMTHSYVDMRL